MERLNLSEKPEHALAEASIHCARYANILPLVKNKTVLDIACGEGYGSALLKKAGAKRVVAVDISSESIEQARKIFGQYGVEYLVGDATRVAELCGKEIFDIVISIETIEHLEQPHDFLHAIKLSAKKDAVFYITCPNDYWYYPKETESNPYHLKKYSFEDFSELTIPILGDNVQWGIGTAVFGFGTIPLDNAKFDKLGKSWIDVINTETTVCVSNLSDSAANMHNCSYYVGLWNAKETSFSNSVFAINMNYYARLFDELEFNVINVLKENQKDNNVAIDILKNDICALSNALDDAQGQVKKLQLESYSVELEREKNADLKNELKRARLLLLAVRSENEALKESIARERERGLSLQSEISHLQVENKKLTTDIDMLRANERHLVATVTNMEVPYYRYLRVSRLIPSPFKRCVMKLVKKVRG
ncbi:methyltransferase domain-containing protein [Plesiomonas shigelloides]|uniref:Methyltransferase type 11 domain-containing protein n=1 Tax=Plesiomonas shigelloides TaxID=703 RepID=A0A4D6U7H4_PLESH|nr:class I SAM-dependent methyltransferase [Plesiomonas shigelloides]KAB7690406.1 methyltransferase domain-containing protein [Plesiomonas shigelloides]QCH03185.1 hypothetical protein [Plesiomonas shigelloides]